MRGSQDELLGIARPLAAALALSVACSGGWAEAPQGTLEKIIGTGTIRLGYQKDLAPFSLARADGRPSG